MVNLHSLWRVNRIPRRKDGAYFFKNWLVVSAYVFLYFSFGVGHQQAALVRFNGFIGKKEDVAGQPLLLEVGKKREIIYKIHFT